MFANGFPTDYPAQQLSVRQGFEVGEDGVQRD